jgi:hypothetical protein
MSRRTTRQDSTPTHDLSRARIVQRLKALHEPYYLYEPCDHHHALNDPLAVEIEGIGMVCDEGITAAVCRHCCTDFVVGTYVVREVCVDEHKHLDGYALCPTMSIVEGRETPWRP